MGHILSERNFQLPSRISSFDILLIENRREISNQPGTNDNVGKKPTKLKSGNWTRPRFSDRRDAGKGGPSARRGTLVHGTRPRSQPAIRHRMRVGPNPEPPLPAHQGSPLSPPRPVRLLPSSGRFHDYPRSPGLDTPALHQVSSH